MEVVIGLVIVGIVVWLVIRQQQPSQMPVPSGGSQRDASLDEIVREHELEVERETERLLREVDAEVARVWANPPVVSSAPSTRRSESAKAGTRA
ncbi:hypothetical protein, partial [Nocardioides sp. GCM10030258]|uniref:hypothetical protein n=1 Tax=unclassified Nocardioides TaxID=2615069 RepID=UPI0036157FEE